jgi:DNA (cytosine-5)-methyltransferase 1
LKVVDLFCGGGGFSEGFKQEGFEIIWAIDNDPFVLETYKVNHPQTEVVCEDILNIDKIPKCDIILSSPPCPSFSMAKIDRDNDLTLVNKSLELIEKVKTKYWILENVIGLGKFLNDIPFNIYNCAFFGVPQFRGRLFAGNYIKPKMTHNVFGGKTLFGDEIKEFVEVKDVLDIQKDSFLVYGGWNYGRKYSINRPIGTLLASSFGCKWMVEINGKRRSLTIEECAILQSFPKDYKFKGSKKTIFRIIGNAVPPLMARKFAEAIKEKEKGE